MFEEVKRNFGFGCMRLPMIGEEVDTQEVNRMVDVFIEAGFNYFDTAHGYIDGKSEEAIKTCLTSRYPRDKYILANKLSDWFFEKEEEVLPLFENQLAICGVEYFDFYLFHALNRISYVKHKNLHTFETVSKLHEEGKVRHIAMSFHDTADVLDMILTEQPQIEVVQLQINYLDYDDPGVQSKACYDVAVKHGKKVIVMEPVRGGYLANLPEKAAKVFTPKLIRAVTIASLSFYCLAKSYSFFTGANHIESIISPGTPGNIISSGLILPLNICVGLVVACTMYAFYTLFRKGGF